MPAPPELAPLLAEIQAALKKALAAMIPNIQTGTSFRGAQLYYLHDKRQKDELLRLSDERVAWTETRNTAHDAADDAFAEMIATARDQDQLKIMSGERLSGRPCEQPVMTISLSWHPSEKPGKEQMMRGGRQLSPPHGLGRAPGRLCRPQRHGAPASAHHLEPHPSRDRAGCWTTPSRRTERQEWARDYEREHGRIWCEERIGKDYSRADGKEPHCAAA